MISKTRWLMATLIILALGLLVWDFTPRASMKGDAKGKSQSTAVTPDVTPNVSYRSPTERHKAQVGDAPLAQEIASRGGRLIADYGASKIFEVNTEMAQSLAPNRAVTIRDEDNLILLNAGAIDTTRPEVQAGRAGVGGFGGKRLHLIQFAGPIRPEWYDALAQTGVRIVTYIPHNAYLVYGNSKNIQAVQELAAHAAVGQWDSAYTSQYRLDAAIQRRAGKERRDRGKAQQNPETLSATGHELYAVQLVADAAENAKTLGLIDRLKLEPVLKREQALDYVNVVAALPVEGVVNELANRADVVSIQPWAMPKKLDERQNQIIAGHIDAGGAPIPGDWLAYLTGQGFNVNSTANFGVNVSDSGIDNATTTPNHFGLYTSGDPTNPANSRVVYNRLEGTPNAGSTLQGCDGHGNINTHIIGGYVPSGTVNGVNFGAAPHADAQGYRYGLGVAPFVKFGSSVIFDPNTFTSPNYFNLEARAYNDGMRVSSNSWGGSSATYSIDSQQYDALVRDAQQSTSVFPTAGNQEMVIVFAAGNDGSGPGTVGFPSTAKNVITVGAAENVQAFGGADGCGVADTGADNANDIIGFSSRGPTADGRHKPDIMAPGTHISGGVAQAALANPTGGGTGARLACFIGGGVCGGVGSNFFPAGQQYYTASSGTSHSTPAISGVAALIRQHFLNQNLTPPTPAMTKGLMMNSARYMTGASANDTLPSNNQGMGEVSLNNYFDIFSTARILRDQVAAETFTASGQQRIITGNIPDSAKPFRVTLAWTDTPGPTSGNAFVNNLDLEVTVGGQTSKGNVFSGANSATGGTADTRNNVESVFIPAGVTGNFIIKVKGTNIAGDGVPNTGGALDQDYALVVYNGIEAQVAVVNASNASLLSESCSPGNGAIDPGEMVSYMFSLANIGTTDTSNLVATLLPTGGVTAPSAPQAYGRLTVGGAAVSRTFNFTANANCGQDLTVTLQLQDGATDLGTVTYTLRTGAPGASVTRTYATGNIATMIPDAGQVDIPLNITDTGAISDVNVRVRLNHTFDSDLILSLIAPDGTTVPLAQNRGGSGVNFGAGTNDCAGTPTIFDDSAATAISVGAAPFAATFRPDSPLSAFNHKSLAGIWKLRVEDTAVEDTGTVGCFTMEVTRNRFSCCGVTPLPQIESGGAAMITAESVTPVNNAPDPGETVTVNFPLFNDGDGNTTNLVATLQSSGGVAPVGNPSRTYGLLVSDGPVVSQSFTFIGSGACGSNITATLQLQDGPLNLGTVTYTFRLGTPGAPTTVFTQAFDTVSAPALPTGWTTAHTGVGVNWVTSTTNPGSQPNNAFAPDVADIGSTELVTPTIALPADGGQLSFSNLFNMEASNSTPTRGFDGMALEISIGGGAFADIVMAGGSFVAGDYTRTIDPDFGNPLAGRKAWSGLSGGTTAAPTYITTTVNLPPSAGGQNIRLKWRAGTDDAFTAAGANGVRVDNISLSGAGPAVCNSQTCSLICPANLTVTAAPGQSGAIVNYPAPSVTGTCHNIAGSPASGTFFPTGTTTVNVTSGAGPSCSFTVTVGQPAASTTLAISEFRLRGAQGPLDEYVEVVNMTNSPFTVTSSDGTGGWSVAALNAAGASATIVATIPNNTVIPARGHYLIANNTAGTGYSLGDYGGTGNAQPDQIFTTDIPDDTSLGLFMTNNPSNLNVGTRVDAIGFVGQAGALSTLFSEGARLPLIGSNDAQSALVREQATGTPKDTGDNAADFDFISPDGATFNGAPSLIGAPGPENLNSPTQRNATVKPALIDPGCTGLTTTAGNACARYRDGASAPNAQFGTLSIRRKFTNKTGLTITRLRFRIVDMTVGPVVGGTADLRARASVGFVATCAGVCSNGTSPNQTTINGVTLESPTVDNNGGLNSTFAPGDIPITSLAPNASANVHFLLGVQQNGNFRFFINIEAVTLPAETITTDHKRIREGGHKSDR